MTDVETPKKLKRLKLPRLKLWQWAALGLVILLLVAGGVLLALRVTKKPNLDNVHVIVTDVGRHYLLPTNETPALATITDKSKLRSSFFKYAENGDKVLIYQTNQIAIIYRPSIDRIIAVGPVSIDTPPSDFSNTSHN